MDIIQPALERQVGEIERVGVLVIRLVRLTRLAPLETDGALLSRVDLRAASANSALA